jgi:hypothetical protein
VAIEPKSQPGQALGLAATTCFRAGNTRLVRVEALKLRPGRCPPGTFQQLRLLAGGHLAARAKPRAGRKKRLTPPLPATSCASARAGGPPGEAFANGCLVEIS